MSKPFSSGNLRNNMAKRATYIVGALNITIHPHRTDLYVSLFKDAFAIRRSVKIHGDTHAVVHTVFDYVEGKPEHGLHGNLIKYTEISRRRQFLASLKRQS